MSEQQSTSLYDILQTLRSESRLMAVEDVVFLIKSILSYLEKKSGFNGDLSPQNIILHGQNEVRLNSTPAGDNFRYMSPERARNIAPQLSSNVFSVGLIFWRLLFGRDIFASGTKEEVIEKVKTFQLPAMPTSRTVAPDLLKVLERMLAADANQRITAAAASTELAQYLKKYKPGYVGKPIKKAEKNDPFAGILTGNREKDLSAIPIYQPARPWKRWLLLFLVLGGGAVYRYQMEVIRKGPGALLEAVQKDFSQILEDSKKTVDPLSNENLLQAKDMKLDENGQLVKVSPTKAETEAEVAKKAEENLFPLKLQTIPAGAEVWVNSQKTKHVTPATLDLPSDNSLSITFKMTGYKPCPAFVSAKVGTFTCRLERLSSRSR